MHKQKQKNWKKIMIYTICSTILSASALFVYLEYHYLVGEFDYHPIVIFEFTVAEARELAKEEAKEEEKPTWQTVIDRVTAELGQEMAMKVYAVISCESGWNSDAVNLANKNKTFDAGLWQINSIHGISNACKFDVNCSTDFAIELIKKQGLKPWTCAKKLGYN